MLVKRIILCILGCILLMVWMGPADADCLHTQVERCDTIEQCNDLYEGHQVVTIKTNICVDCGEKIIQRQYGEFKGHVFYMAENLHFEEDQAHLFVFICQECHHILVEEIRCVGNCCLIYHAQAGENPPVEYLGHLDAWKQDNPEEAIVSRWLARQQDE